MILSLNLYMLQKYHFYKVCEKAGGFTFLWCGLPVLLIVVIWVVTTVVLGEVVILKLSPRPSLVLGRPQLGSLGFGSSHGSIEVVVEVEILKVSNISRVCRIFNRPGVAGAVLQSPPSLINSLTD